MTDFTFFSLYATSSFFFQTSSEGIVSRRLADVNPKGSKVAREQIGEIREEVELQEVKTQACWDPGLSWKDISPLIDRKDPGFIERWLAGFVTRKISLPKISKERTGDCIKREYTRLAL